MQISCSLCLVASLSSRKTCMNLSSLSLSSLAVSLTTTTGLGWHKELLPLMPSGITYSNAYYFGSEVNPRNCLTWKGKCKCCGKLRKNGFELFFSNFLLQWEISPCARMCGEEVVSSELRTTHSPFKKTRTSLTTRCRLWTQTTWSSGAKETVHI
jgi:hypothetical protein